MSEFSDTLQRVNKNRTKHFPCYLFIFLVLRFISNTNDKISLVMNVIRLLFTVISVRKSQYL